MTAARRQAGRRALVTSALVLGAVLLGAQTSNDPLYSNQWHLRNTGQGGGVAGEDANVEAAWLAYSVRGSPNEIIAIVDDGLEIGHEDLAPNVVAGLSYNYQNGSSNPTTANPHGTSVAGVAAARGNNGIGVSGVAPLAGLVGFSFLALPTSANEIDALTRASQQVDIYSNSWGPPDQRGTLDAMSSLTAAALATGVRDGRAGRGSIYLWAAGNGRLDSSGILRDNSNYDGYANSRYAIAVSASTNTGKAAWYSEEGANVLVTAPSSGGTLGITTTDLTGSPGYSSSSYTSTFGGTSSACPLVAGVVALMLQANPSLGWRDVREILAVSAEQNAPADEDWSTNGAGFHVNHKFGFGRVDAERAVTLAAGWTNLGPELTVTASASPNTPILDSPGGATLGPPVVSSVTITDKLRFEFADVRFTSANHTYWADLQIELIAPSGTISVLSRPHLTAAPGGINNWRFGTVRHLGESSVGTWSLRVRDGAPRGVGTFQSWSIKIYGTSLTPPAAPAQITSPAPGSTFTGLTTTFQWSSGTGVSRYWLDIGRARGGADIFSAAMGTQQSATVGNLPYSGEPVFVRLYSNISEVWQFVDYEYRAVTAEAARITSPTPGTTLPGTTVTFQWTAGRAVSAYWLYVGRTLGGSEEYNAYQGTNQSVTLGGLPNAGGPLYVRLYSKIGETWSFADYTYTAYDARRPATITSPTPGTTLPNTTVLFTWDPGVGVSDYWLTIGAAQGGYDILNQSQGVATSTTVINLPANGGAIWVRLFSRIGGSWAFVDYRYTAPLAQAAQIVSPAPGSLITSSSITFQWDAGVGATRYWLYVGSAVGGSDYYNRAMGSLRSETVSGLPTDGRFVYVRLYSYIESSDSWVFVDYRFGSPPLPAPAAVVSPPPGSTLSGSSVTFTWTAGSGADRYWFYVGTLPGAADIYDVTQGGNLSVAVGGIPVDGRTIYVRLYSHMTASDSWVYADYTYRAKN